MVNPQPFKQYPGKHKIDFIKNIIDYYPRGKESGKAITAVARELAGFIWAITQEVEEVPEAT